MVVTGTPDSEPVHRHYAARMLRLSGGDARLTIDSEHGGRISSLVVGGRELIMWRRLRTIDWGSYPMAPFAGRLRDGRFTFEGRTYQLPITEGPNAIHGTTLECGLDRDRRSRRSRSTSPIRGRSRDGSRRRSRWRTAGSTRR